MVLPKVRNPDRTKDLNAKLHRQVGPTTAVARGGNLREASLPVSSGAKPYYAA